MKTPYYVVDSSKLEAEYFKLKKALNKYWDNYIVGYSYKTNSLPWIVKYFHNQGCYAEVVSEDEYNLSKVLNNRMENTIYNGPIKSENTFLEALESGAIVNIDSQRELEWLKNLKMDKEYNIGLRVNIDLEKYLPGHSSCGDSRFGFSYENGSLGVTIEKIKQLGLTISGLHLHVSTKTRAVEVYKVLAKMALEIVDVYNLELKYLDFGGGFFGGLTNKPEFKDYILAISEIIKKQYVPDNLKLILEPGMSLIGSVVKYVTSVTDIKEINGTKYVVTDGSRIHIDPFMKKNSYFYELQCSNNSETINKQIICGFTCMEFDRLMSICNDRKLQVGDKIIYDKVGAYTMCLSPLFINYFPDVYLEKENKLTILRNRWTEKEYIQNSFLER